MIQHESKFYNNRLKKVFAGINARNPFKYARIESHMRAGVLDVAYSYNGHNGWIELKSVEANGLNVNLSHFTKEQAIFITEHGKIGGHCYLLVEVRAIGTFLFNHTKANLLYEVRKKLTIRHLMQAADCWTDQDVKLIDMLYKNL